MLDPPQVSIRDCGSRNGTYINGMQIGWPEAWGIGRAGAAQEYCLHDGDQLRVGDTVFQVNISVPGRYSLQAEPPASEEAGLCICS